MIKAVAKEENLKLKFNETSWDSMFAGLDAGRFDVIANQVGVNKDREKKYKFSEPYTYSSAVLVVRENEKDITSFNDVKGKKLDYRKQKPNAKIKAIKGHAEQNKSAFAFSKKVDEKTIEKFNKGLEKIRDNGELAKIGKKWFGQDVSKPE